MINRIKIKLGQIEFEAEGESELIERERQEFFSILPHAITAVSSTIMVTEHPKLTTEEIPLSDNISPQSLVDSEAKSYDSLITFLKEKDFQNDVELTLGVTYYIDCIDNVGPVTVKDIENKLLEARKGKPSNINQCINLNIRKGYMAEYPDKKDGHKTFTLLSEGIKWCQSYTLTEKKAKKKPSSLKNPKTVKESELIKISLDELNLDKYIDISKLDKFREQLLVVMLIYTREKNIEYFKINDLIAIFKHKFRLSATDKQIDGVFRRAGTDFDKKTENGVHYRMLQGAINEADSIIARDKERQ